MTSLFKGSGCRRRAEWSGSDHSFPSTWIGRRLGDAERRRVIVLSCIVHSLSTESDSAFLKPSQHIFRIIERYHGRVGPASDGVLRFYWGFPQSEESDARCAVLAALDLVANSETNQRFACAIDTACVISEGPGRGLENPHLIESELLKAGLLRPDKDHGSVVVSEAIGSMVGADFELAEDRWKNSQARLHVIGVRRDKSHTPTCPIVGRLAERDALERTWSKVAEGQPHCISLTGEPGIGKTKLLRELEKRCAASCGIWIEVDCRPEFRDAPHGVRQRWQTLRENLFSEFIAAGAIDWLREGAQTRPIAVVFEDIHWADPATFDFMVAIGNRLHELGRVCLIWTSRRDHLAGFTTAAPKVHLALGRLYISEIDQMVAQHPSHADMPSDVREAIAVRSEGVPLFAEELVRLQAGTDRYSPDILLEPGRLSAVLSARLDAIGELRPFAQAAAVIGRDFDASTLATLLRMDRAQLAAGLSALVEKDVIERLPSALRSSTYRFSHALLRDAAYASILQSHRCNLHRAVAEILSQDAAREADHSPEIVAAHFAAAKDARGAFIWWRKAGWRAAKLSAPESAVQYFEQALMARAQNPSEGSLAEQAEILKALGVQLVSRLGNAAEEVFDTFQRCWHVARQLPGSAAEFDAMWMLQSCHLVRGDILKAINIGERLVATADGDGTDEQRMRAHRIQGLARLLSGRLGAAFAHFRVVLGIYDEKRHACLRFEHASDQGALAHAHLAWGKAIALKQDASAHHAERALELASRLQHPHTSAHVMCVLAARAQTIGDRQNASALAFAGKSLSERHEFPYWKAWASVILGWSEADRAGGGLAVIDQALKSYLRTGARQAVPYAMTLYAETALAQGLPTKALAALQEGWLLAERNGIFLYASELLRLRAIANRHLGMNSQHVTESLEKARAVAAEQKAQLFYQRASAALDGASIQYDYENMAAAL